MECVLNAIEGIVGGEGMKAKIIIPWPKCDEYNTPLLKLPACPRCDMDELSMLYSDKIFCNYCYYFYHPNPKYSFQKGKC